jgi:nucleoside phosphorylase/5'-deoxynucleotidase YfbR-like HD superfamily hydrolase
MPPRSNTTIDCAVIIALPEEFQAKPGVPSFEDLFACQQAGTFGAEHFRHFTFNDNTNSGRKGIVTVLHGMGPARSLAITQQIIEEFDPTTLVNIGIAGALSDDLRLGDIVVADFADHYSYRAKSKEGTGTQFGGKPYSTSYQYFNATQQLWFTHEDQFWAWQKYCSDMLDRALPSQKQEELVRSKLINRRPAIKGGPLACGDTVVVTDELRNAILEHNRTFLAVDMESAGFLQACYERKHEYRRLVLKAVTDFADERKHDLDHIDNGAIRSWAISNSYVLLHLVLTRLLDFQRSRAPRPARPMADKERATLADAIHAAVADRNLKTSYRNSGLDANRLDRLDAVFRLVSESPILRTHSGVLQQAAEWIAASHHEYPLAVEGRPGVGKSSFLNALYIYLRRSYESDRGRPLPFYIDLKNYDAFPHTAGRPEAVRQFTSDIGVLTTYAEKYPGDRVVVLLDGIREYVLADETLESEAVARLHRYPNVCRVVSLGRTYIPDKPRFKRDLSHFENAQEILVLGSLPIASPDCAAFCDALQQEVSGASSLTLQSRALELANSLGFEELDMFVLSLLLERMTRHGYRDLTTRREWLHKYCTEYLAGSAVSISAAAKLAFDYAISSLPLEHHLHVGSAPWRLLHRHRVVKDFLVAYHVVDVVRAVGRGSDKEAGDLNYVYPFRINAFCKEMVTAGRDVQFEVLHGCEQLYKEGGPNAKPHACYLAGRVSNYQVREEAIVFLRDCNIETQKRLRLGTLNTPGELLLARTIYISLMNLGDDKAADEYLSWLMHNERWDDLNRGFHLEYYGDISFDPDRQMIHSDPMDAPTEILPCRKTLAQLVSRIRRHIQDSSYKMFAVEVYTAYSLAQHRHAKNVLPPSDRDTLLDLIPRILLNSNIARSKPLKQYLSMITQNFHGENFPIGRLAERLYRIKTEERKGWRRRTESIPRVESVADHMYCAYLLGQLYLPNDNAAWIGYDKRRVLEIILVHDLAEAITGDTPAETRSEADVDEERRAVEYIAACGTYLKVANLDFIAEYAAEFEGGSTLNGQVARDVDLLENLMQLFLYRPHLSEVEFDRWYGWITDRVCTNAGREILGTITENFKVRPGSPCQPREAPSFLPGDMASDKEIVDQDQRRI